MRILHVSPSYYPATHFGGPIQSVHLLNKTLAKKGIFLDVITTNAGISKTRVHEWIDNFIKEDGWCHFDGIRIKYLGYIGYVHYNFSISLVRELKKIINNYDLVHITAVWNFPVLAAAYYCKKYKIPYIISPRGTIYKETIEFKSTYIKKIYYKLFAKKYLNNASAIHFTTQDEIEKVKHYLKLKSAGFVIPNGIDLSESTNSNRNDILSKYKLQSKKYILILGRLDRKKGFDLLIPAFSEIVKKYSDVYLVIAGDQSTTYNHSIIQLIQKYNLSDRVIFTGQVSGNDKWALYKNGIMFILPSYSENFGMSVVEAMACNCPVVISDKVGIYKVIERYNAGVIVQTTIESVEEGIDKLIDNKNLRYLLSQNGKAMVEKNYNIDMVAFQMIQHYKSIKLNHII